jgi:predicted secreted protein
VLFLALHDPELARQWSKYGATARDLDFDWESGFGYQRRVCSFLSLQDPELAIRWSKYGATARDLDFTQRESSRVLKTDVLNLSS